MRIIGSNTATEQFFSKTQGKVSFYFYKISFSMNIQISHLELPPCAMSTRVNFP